MDALTLYSTALLQGNRKFFLTLMPSTRKLKCCQPIRVFGKVKNFSPMLCLSHYQLKHDLKVGHPFLTHGPRTAWCQKKVRTFALSCLKLHKLEAKNYV